MSRLLPTLAVLVLALLALASPARASDQDPLNVKLTVFTAVPKGDGTTARISALLDGEPNSTYNLRVWGGDCGTSTDDGGGLDAEEGDFQDPAAFFEVTTDSDGAAYIERDAPLRAGTAGTTDVTIAVYPPPVGDPGIWAHTWQTKNCYPVTPDNTGWTKAEPVALNGGNGTQTGIIALPGETRWYKFEVPPDARATITSPDAGGVAVFSDIGAAEQRVDNTGDLLRLGASAPQEGQLPARSLPSRFIPSRFIPSRFIPSRFIPSRFIPSRFIPSRFISSAFSPDVFSPSRFIGDAFASGAFSPGAFSPSRFIPSRFISAGFVPSRFIPATYSSAVTDSFVTADVSDGPKTLTVNAYDRPRTYYVAMSGDEDPLRQLRLNVSVSGSDCDPSVADSGAPPAPVANTNRTLILTDPARLQGSAAEKADLASRLDALAGRPEVDGKIVDLGANSRVQGLQAQADANPDCPYAENLVAAAIKDIVDAYRAGNPGLKYVVIAGGDDVVPFFRYPDPTAIGNERDYDPPVRDGTPSQASLRRGYILTQDPYSADKTITVNGQSFPLPGLAIGRLVETAPEISRVVSAYLDTTGGVVPTPTSSLVTGYDFLAPAAERIRDDLAAGTGQTVDTLIDPQAPAAGTQPWTGAQLANKLTGSRHDLMFLGGHFSANNTLAADFSTDVVTTDLEQSDVDLRNSIVFSAGCHSAYNILDRAAVPGRTLPLDWAQAFARKGATLIGGTGYQYGDTDFIEYSLRLYTDFAKQLRLGSGPVPLGAALQRAKQRYLEDTPQLGDIHRKALLEATLFGLPMLSVDLPGRIPAAGDDASTVTPAAAGSEPGATLGLSSADVALSPSLTERTKTLASDPDPVTASYLTGPDGLVTNPFEPVLPLAKLNVAVPGQALRGVAFLGGRYTDERRVTPLTGAPATQTSEAHTPWDSDVFFPLKPWSVNYFGALARDGGPQELMVTPAQHKTDPTQQDTAVRRRFSVMRFRLFYSANTQTYGSGEQADTPALAAPPDVSQVGAVAGDRQVMVCAMVGGNPSAGVQSVLATWSDASAGTGDWSTLALTRGGCDANAFAGRQDSKNWGGVIEAGDVAPADVRFMVQAVNGVGLVTLADDLGRYFRIDDSPKSTCGSRFTTIDQTAGMPGAPVAAGATLTLGARLSSASSALPGQPVRFTIGTESVTALTGADGTATARLTMTVPGTYRAIINYPGGIGPGYGDCIVDYDPASADLGGVTVTAQHTSLQLARVDSPELSPGEVRFTALLCADNDAVTGCGSDDTPLADRSIRFTLDGADFTGRTDGAGVARFSRYGLPPGPHRLEAAFTATSPDLDDAADAADFATQFADTTPPVLKVPADIGIRATTAGGTLVSYVARATDDVDPRPVVTCDKPPLSLFALGTSTVTCRARDTAGNQSDPKSFKVSIDGTPPSISRQISGTLGANGWYRSDVTVRWTVRDDESPATATGCGDVSITADQAPTPYTCSAVSVGGSASDVVSIKRDATPPQVAVTGVTQSATYPPLAVPAAGCTTTDGRSGVAQAATLSLAGGPLGTVTATCAGAKDDAGNTTPPVAVTYTVADTTKPVITPTIVGTLGANGWYTSNVTLTWTVTDPDSLISTQTGCGPTALTADQAASDYTCTATSAGGTQTRAVTLKRDATPPAVQVTGVQQGGSYSSGSLPVAGCSTTDATSGVDVPRP